MSDTGHTRAVPRILSTAGHWDRALTATFCLEASADPVWGWVAFSLKFSRLHPDRPCSINPPAICPY